VKRSDLRDLLVLAALWGASFLFMRITAPAFGPWAMAALRVTGAALLLLPVVRWRGEWPMLVRHWRTLLVVGIANSALPFALFGYASLHLTGGLASIFNASTPLSSFCCSMPACSRIQPSILVCHWRNMSSGRTR